MSSTNLASLTLTTVPMGPGLICDKLARVSRAMAYFGWLSHHVTWPASKQKLAGYVMARLRHRVLGMRQCWVNGMPARTSKRSELVEVVNL